MVTFTQALCYQLKVECVRFIDEDPALTATIVYVVLFFGPLVMLQRALGMQ